MNGFVCVVSDDGHRLSPTERVALQARYARLGDGIITWLSDGPCELMIAQDGYTPAVHVGHSTDRIVVGMLDGVRRATLDRAITLEMWIDGAMRAPGGLKALPGAFSLVTWCGRTRTLVAARDNFGIKALFYRLTARATYVASHASLLETDAGYDEACIAEFLMQGCITSTRTMFAGVNAVPPGGFMRSVAGRSSVDTYWTPSECLSQSTVSLDDGADQLRGLLTESVRVSMADGASTWTQLSGGLDSSSILAIAETLHNDGITCHGLAGSVTFVDSLGSGDERQFSEAMLERYPIRNERITDYWPWHEEDGVLPVTDQPRMTYPYHARDRRMCEIVTAAGSHVLLSGHGSDNYLTGNRGFITDLVARGHPWQAIKALASWSTQLQQSFWRMAYDHAVQPILPQAVRQLLLPKNVDVPAWIAPRFAERYGLHESLRLLRRYATPGIGYWTGETLWQIKGIAAFIERDVFEQGLEIRYPFLYRPLVELALRLEPRAIARPNASKYVLREAMRDLLPEVVRSRTGKGTVGARTRWALTKERQKINALATDTILEQLGCTRPGLLRVAVSRYRRGHGRSVVRLFAALSLETWLRVRSGQWPPARASATRVQGVDVASLNVGSLSTGDASCGTARPSSPIMAT